MKYDDEIADIDGQLNLLCQEGLLKNGGALDNLEDYLELLSAPNVRTLYKNFCKGKDNTKEEQVKALLNHSKKKSFFMSKTSITEKKVILYIKKSIAEKILKYAKAIDSKVTNSFLVEDKL